MSGRLKVGFIGLGAISHEHVRGYLGAQDAEIVGVCSTNETDRSWLRQYGLEGTFYTDYELMLKNEQLDIVEVLTPHYLHHPQAIACARAGVMGVSVQKPMALTLHECDDIIAECSRNDVSLKVYENFVFYPVFTKAKELIDGGLIGELISIRVNTLCGVRDGAKWPTSLQPGSWRMDLSKSGFGPLVGDDGYHKFSLARWLMGRDLERVSAWIEPDTPLDAPALIRATFRRLPGDGPKYAQIDFSFLPRMAIPCDFWLDDFVEVVGEKGIMWVNQCSGGGDRARFTGNEMSQSPVFPPIAVFLDGKVNVWMADISPSERNWSSSFVASTRHFISVIKAGGRPVYTGEEGREITRYIIAAMLSAQEQREVLVDEITTEAEDAGRWRLRTNFCNLESRSSALGLN